MTSNEMWHIERMGDVLRHLGLPWFAADEGIKCIRVKVISEDFSELYVESFNWDWEND